MSDIKIPKTRFLELFDAILGDHEFELELLRKLLSAMPRNVVHDEVVKYYFENIFKGTYYVATHATFSNEVRYFYTYQLLTLFLQERDLGFSIVSPSNIKKCFDNQAKSLCGYHLKEVKMK